MINIVIPMAGVGKKFVDRGYTFPKPLIELRGRPLIEIVADNLRPSAPHRFIFVCRKEHLESYALSEVLRLIAPDCVIVPIPGETAGALCTVLLAMDFINNSDELLIANADQYVAVPVDKFLSQCRAENAAGCIMTFPSTHPKWSYVKLDNGDNVVTVAEKRPISRHATVGLYYFRSGALFISAAERQILKAARSSGEFFVCPVYNELILDGQTIKTSPIDSDEMHSLGTPEDVEEFLKTGIIAERR